MTTTKYVQLPKPLIGIGSCLAGNAVRYNGETNSPNQSVRDIGEHFDFQAFCPEMGIGLGVPRPPIHLVGSTDSIRVLDVETHRHDYTDAIRSYARYVLDQAPLLCAYILVQGSPSCGAGGVKRYSQASEYIASDQAGIFASALGEADPLLPLEDDARLNEPGIRDIFVIRARAYHDWKTLSQQALTAQGLIDFYTRYKQQLIAQHLPGDTLLEPTLARTDQQALEEMAADLINTLMAALSCPTTEQLIARDSAGAMRRLTSCK